MEVIEDTSGVPVFQGCKKFSTNPNQFNSLKLSLCFSKHVVVAACEMRPSPDRTLLTATSNGDI